MRYRRILSKEQIKYLLEHCDINNKELAHKLNTRSSIIATYKTRARKKGYKIPFSNTLHSTIDEDINNAITKLKQTKKG